MKSAKKYMLPLIAVMVFLAVTAIGYAVTSVTPTASTTVSGSYNFTATATFSGIENCTWATTADGVFAWMDNTTAGQTSFWNYTDTTGLTDASSTTLTLICYNASGTVNENTTVSIAVDNTAPTAVLELDQEIIETKKPIRADCSGSTDAIDTSLSYQQQLRDPDGTAVGSNCTTAQCDWDDGDAGYSGEYTVECTVTDNGGNSNSDSVAFNVVRRGTSSEVVVSKHKSNTQLVGVLAGVLVLLIAVVAVIVVAGKKKKR